MAIVVPSNCLILWPGTTASIPVNFTRQTGLDDRYLQISITTAPLTAGGSSSHTHTANTHYHTQSHTHLLTISGVCNSTTIAYTQTKPITQYSIAAFNHTHRNSNTTTNSSDTGDTSPTVNSTTAHPPYYTFIFIKPNDNNQTIPNNSIVFDVSGNYPTTNFSVFSSANNMFALGASTGNGGATTGGTTTHSHTSTGHTHNMDHSHSDSNFGTATPVTNTQQPPDVPTEYCQGVHHKATSIGLTNPTLSTENYGFDSTQNYPSYIKLLGIKNNSGSSQDVFEGCALPFIVTSSAVPSGWKLCNGNNNTLDCRGKQIWITTNSGEIGDTGGNNTHSHTQTEHIHAEATAGHFHTYSFTTESQDKRSGSTIVAGPTHSHSSHNMGSTAITTATSNSTTLSADIRYNYTTIHMIQYTGAVEPIEQQAIFFGANF